MPKTKPEPKIEMTPEQKALADLRIELEAALASAKSKDAYLTEEKRRRELAEARLEGFREALKLVGERHEERRPFPYPFMPPWGFRG